MAISKIKNEGLRMKKTTLSIFGILAMTVGVWATVPYTFTPYTPAKASEVNANFQALSDKLSTLENNVTNNSAAIASESGNCDQKIFPFTYQYTPSSIGDTVTINGVEYIMVAEPFIEHGTGDHYYIKRPIVKTNNSKNINLYSYIYTYYVQQGTECYPLTFSGFPSKYSDGIDYRHYYNASIADPADTSNDYEIENWASATIFVKINQTTLQLNFSIRNKLQQTLIDSGDVDLRDNINWSVLDVDTSLVDNLKTLINYVEIVKIEP